MLRRSFVSSVAGLVGFLPYFGGKKKTNGGRVFYRIDGSERGATHGDSFNGKVVDFSDIRDKDVFLVLDFNDQGFAYVSRYYMRDNDTVLFSKDGRSIKVMAANITFPAAVGFFGGKLICVDNRHKTHSGCQDIENIFL